MSVNASLLTKQMFLGSTFRTERKPSSGDMYKYTYREISPCHVIFLAMLYYKQLNNTLPSTHLNMAAEHISRASA
jgi:hypothetical protein